MLTNDRQQCYGYGNIGECKSSFIGYNVPSTSGGELETACLLYSQNLDPNDFVKALAGQYVNATAASIYCPS